MRNGFPTLDDLGITRKLSHRAQRLAEIPAKDFDWYLRTAAAKNQQRIVGGRIDDLIGFARTGPKMGSILIDPPWPIAGTTLPYMHIHMGDLRKLPIAELAAERCHVHLWTLPNSYHRTAYDLVEQWGFRVVSEFVWCKTQAGRAIIGGCPMKSF
jgi:MT-A70